MPRAETVSVNDFAELRIAIPYQEPGWFLISRKHFAIAERTTGPWDELSR